MTDNQVGLHGIAETEADATRSPAGGWSGEGVPQHADFVKVRRGNVHIVRLASWNGVTTMCPAWYPLDKVTPASGDEPEQCRFCWEAV